MPVRGLGGGLGEAAPGLGDAYPGNPKPDGIGIGDAVAPVTGIGSGPYVGDATGAVIGGGVGGGVAAMLGVAARSPAKQASTSVTAATPIEVD